MGDIRQLISETALSKNDEVYAGHVKIYEDDETGSKSRFILLSCQGSIATSAFPGRRADRAI